MEITNNDRVGKALDILCDGLQPFVEQKLTARYGKKWFTEVTKGWQDLYKPEGVDTPNTDVAFLLRAMWEQWNPVFGGFLSPTERSLVGDLREIDQKWVCQELLTTDEVQNTLDAASGLLAKICVPQAKEIEKIRKELRRTEQTLKGKKETELVETRKQERTAKEAGREERECEAREENMLPEQEHILQAVVGPTEQGRKAAEEAKRIEQEHRERDEAERLEGKLAARREAECIDEELHSGERQYDALLSQAAVCYQQGDKRQALNLLEKALAQQPDHAGTLRGMLISIDRLADKLAGVSEIDSTHAVKEPRTSTRKAVQSAAQSQLLLVIVGAAIVFLIVLLIILVVVYGH